jgi:hypothetical protein
MITLTSNNTKGSVFCVTVICLVTFGIYWNALQGDFIWDDRGLILDSSSYLGDWRNVFSSFTKPFFGTTPFYRPLLIVSFILDYQLWGLNAFGYHFSNVVLHALNALMVYLLAFLLFKQKTFAWIAGLLFATHPIQTEAVAWISGRNDVLLTFFSLLTIICYLRWRMLGGTKRVIVYVGFLLSYCCVLLTKESGIILPVLIVLVDYFFRNSLPHPLGGRKKVYLPLILVSVLYIYLRMNLLGSADLGTRALEPFHTFTGVIITYAYYLKMLLFPIVQTASPSILPIVSFKNPLCIASFFLVGSLVVVTVACWNRFRELSFTILWVFVALLPVSGIIPLTVPALEHRLYLGSVCFSMVIPLLLYKIFLPGTHESFFSRRSLCSLFILVALIMVYSSKTVTRNTIWRDEHTFWLHTVKDSPSSLFAHNNLGSVYARKGQHDKAIRIFKKALSLPKNEDPSRSAVTNGTRLKIYNNLGQSYQALLEKQLSHEVKKAQGDRQ